MKARALLLAATAAIPLLCGCDTTLKATAVNASGHFPTETILPADQIKISKPYSEQYSRLVFIRFEGHEGDAFVDFMVRSLRNMNRFAKIDQKSDMEKMVIDSGLAQKIGNISDLVALNNLEREIGPFLIVEPRAHAGGRYTGVASIRAIDPATGEAVFFAENTAVNWDGLDQPLFYPLLNAFVDWTAPPK